MLDEQKQDQNEPLTLATLAEKNKDWQEKFDAELAGDFIAPPLSQQSKQKNKRQRTSK